ncbi:neuroguidin-like [Haliotis rufescens]|uniref:neuroguidin-like n=1 Tax=Haliotis rufescens TaxID=6454 RepID=UPI001EB00D09|nr:neuroguidin-like [Haliotis rufescens]
MEEHIVERDLPAALALLKDIKVKAGDAVQHVSALLQRVKDGEFDTSKGVSFLEVKYQMLLSYLTNLTFVLLKKTSGQSIERDASIERLVEIRTVLEKMRPIDQKLKYQVDKLIKTATTGASDANDPLRFKANPHNLVSKLDEEQSESDSADEDKPSKSKAYVAPKLAPVHYTGDETALDRQQRQTERAMKRALSSNMLRDLKDQYYDGPEEVKESTDLHRMSENKKAKERLEYEEANFLRLPMTKKEKAAMKSVQTMSTLNRLTDFDDISALAGGEGRKSTQGGKKRKGSMGKKGKQKGSKKRQRRH